MRKKSFNLDWKFWKDGNEEHAVKVILPHDAMIYEKRVPEMKDGASIGYFPGGKYFYQKNFIGTEEMKNQTVIVEFEAIYMNSTVYLNGEKVGGWVYGYTNFFVDLTDKIRIGEENVLLVIADNSLTPNSRWYSGSGIYRPVHLWLGEKTSIKPQGLKIKTKSIDPAVIEVQTELINNKENVHIKYRVYEGESLVATGDGKHTEFAIENPRLWSDETPFLYEIKASVYVGDVLVDETIEKFGIRTIRIESNKGLLINDKVTKLRGGCLHHDNGILGGCTYRKAEYRRIKKMKEFGYNAIRFSHYPAGKDLLEVCDELGMYILDESFDQWRRPGLEYDYSIYFDQEWEKDLRALAQKDYNHPSVIMYCIGNEITDTGRSYGLELTKLLTAVLKEEDDSRPVTIANNDMMSIIADAMEQLEEETGAAMGSLQINELITKQPELMLIYQKGGLAGDKVEKIVGKVFDTVDIAGHNYANDIYEECHSINDQRLILSTETFPQRMYSNWMDVVEKDYVIGDFHWTAWDYLGEAGVGVPVYGTKEAPFAKAFPCLTAGCGSFDLNGNPEAAAYYTATLWGVNKIPYICVRPVNHSGEDYTIGQWRLTDAVHSWTWNDGIGKIAEVIVYSCGSNVELFLNGKSVGMQKLEEYKAEFQVMYEDGELMAISYDENAVEIGKSVLQSSGDKYLLSIEPEEIEVKANVEDIVFVPIYIRDENGNLCMNKDKKVTVQVDGEGELIALGSAKYINEELEVFHKEQVISWHGNVLAVIRPSGNKGEIKVSAAMEGVSAGCSIIVK